MTEARTYSESEGEFGEWEIDELPCRSLGCTAVVRRRLWSSHDGGHEDVQFTCDAGHVWWIDGIDS